MRVEGGIGDINIEGRETNIYLAVEHIVNAELSADNVLRQVRDDMPVLARSHNRPSSICDRRTRARRRASRRQRCIWRTGALRRLLCTVHADPLNVRCPFRTFGPNDVPQPTLPALGPGFDSKVSFFPERVDSRAWHSRGGSAIPPVRVSVPSASERYFLHLNLCARRAPYRARGNGRRRVARAVVRRSGEDVILMSIECGAGVVGGVVMCRCCRQLED